MHQSPESLLQDAIADQRSLMRGYEIPSEALTLETLRALDHAFCRELIPHLRPQDSTDLLRNLILRRGVNEALSRVLPRDLGYERPRLFPSTAETREKADRFLFDSGLLWLADRLLVQVRAGFLSGEVDLHHRVDGDPILVLTASDDTLYNESIGYAGVDWLSDRALQRGRPKEEELLVEREAMLPAMRKRLFSASGHGGELHPDADRHFHECSQVYMSRMPFRDLLADRDSIGGRPYSDYVEVLTALGAMWETRLWVASTLHKKRPQLGLRNLLTGASFFGELVESLTGFLDAETRDVEHLLSHLTLSPRNAAVHLSRGAPAWAPVVQTSFDFCVLPCYGLDINPFLFLASELRERYKKEWFEAANAREGRWVSELEGLFPAPRWQCASGILIKRAGRDVTDIDFVAYDAESRSIALFQLKWQQPPVGDEKIRRNNAGGVIEAGNRWVGAVCEWLDGEGMDTLRQRLSLRPDDLQVASLFVLGRYGAHFSGHANGDARAAWSDWGHFEQERSLHPAAGPTALFDNVVQKMRAARSEVQPESLMLPLPGLALVLNPASRPPSEKG